MKTRVTKKTKSKTTKTAFYKAGLGRSSKVRPPIGLSSYFADQESRLKYATIVLTNYRGRRNIECLSHKIFETVHLVDGEIDVVRNPKAEGVTALVIEKSSYGTDGEEIKVVENASSIYLDPFFTVAKVDIPLKIVAQHDERTVISTLEEGFNQIVEADTKQVLLLLNEALKYNGAGHHITSWFEIISFFKKDYLIQKLTKFLRRIVSKHKGVGLLTNRTTLLQLWSEIKRKEDSSSEEKLLIGEWMGHSIILHDTPLLDNKIFAFPLENFGRRGIRKDFVVLDASGFVYGKPEFGFLINTLGSLVLLDVSKIYCLELSTPTQWILSKILRRKI